MLFLIYCGYIFLGVGFFAYIFPQYYFSELFLSFLPYHIGITFLGLIIGIIVFRRFLRKEKLEIISIKKSILGLLIIGLGLIFMLFSKKFTTFYNFPVSQINIEMTGGVKILYANIYKNNTDYTKIESLIEKENPDLIFFVEFADHHYQNLKKLLEKSYPYTNSTIWSKKFVGNMVFSKLEIDNRSDDFVQGAWRYGYFSVIYDNKPIYFYLVHASSPSNSKYFRMRNAQISTFFKDFDLHKAKHREKNDKVIVMGDFNTTPWSQYYRNFAQGFSGEFVNITRSFPILFTRRLTALPIFWAHIDHIFANKQVMFSTIQTIDIPGSDHRGYSFLVK